MAGHSLLWSWGGALVSAGGLLMAANAVRAFANAEGFARYLGLPLVSPNDAPMVHVYALRAALIALLVFGLVASGERLALAVTAFAAFVMPFGDAVLTVRAGAARATVIRHVLIAIFLLITGIVLAWPLAEGLR